MKLVIIESPYAGHVERNIKYARLCMLDCLLRGEAPFASHLLYTSVLDDNRRVSRFIGIKAGLAWKSRASLTIFYTNFGWSDGMLAARAHCEDNAWLWEERQLNPEQMERLNGANPLHF